MPDDCEIQDRPLAPTRFIHIKAKEWLTEDLPLACPSLSWRYVVSNYRQFLIIILVVIIVVTCRVSMAKTLNFSCIEETPDIEISRLVLAEAYGRLGIDITIQELPGLRALIYAMKV